MPFLKELVRRGVLSADQVRTYDADALVDTGAVRTVLPPEVVARLGLATRGQQLAEYADGRKRWTLPGRSWSNSKDAVRSRMR